MSDLAIKRPDLKKTIAKVGVPTAADIPSKLPRKPLKLNAKPGETTGKDSPSDTKPSSKPVRSFPVVKSKESKLEADLKEARRQKKKLEQEVQTLQTQLKEQKTKADRAKKRAEEADLVFAALRKVLGSGRDAKPEGLPERVAQRMKELETKNEESIIRESEILERINTLGQELKQKDEEISRLQRELEPIVINANGIRQRESSIFPADEEISTEKEIIPSFFSTVNSTNTLDAIVHRYCSWVLGVGEFSGNRSRTRNNRIDVGVDPAWRIDNLKEKESITLEGKRGLRIDVRSARGDWRLRFDHNDSQVEGTTWSNVVHITARPEGGTCIEHAVIRSTGANTRRPDPQGIPRVFKDLLRESQNHQPWSDFKGDARWMHEDAVEDFVSEVLLNPERNLPVVYISNAASTGNPLVDPDELAKKLDGLAVVFVQRFDNKFLLSEAFQRKGLDRMLSCYDGGVRLFHPGLSQNADPKKHNLWIRSILEKKPLPIRLKIIANSIAASVVGSRVPPSFARLIEDFDVQAARSKTAHMAAFGDAKERILAFENQVKILDEALASSRAETSVIPGLRRELETSKNNANIYLEACIQAERDRDYFKDELDRTRRLLFNLRAQFYSKESGPTEVVIPIPETYDELPQWVETHLAERLVLHPRAKRGLKLSLIHI